MTSFSVICPMHNSAAFIEQTLMSVVNQTFRRYELIVIDDGSIDNSVEVVKRFFSKHCVAGANFKLIETSHAGPGEARNIGIRAANYDWVAFIDSDDTWESSKLDVMQLEILAHPEINFFCHAEWHVTLDGDYCYVDYSSFGDANKCLESQLFNRNLFSTSAVVVKKEILKASSLFDKSLMNAQDYELWLRLAPHIKVKFVSMPLGCYNHREGNITDQNKVKKYRNLFLILWRYKNYSSFAVLIKKTIILSIRLIIDLAKLGASKI